MPTYEYACTACEHRFEAVQSFSDLNLTECPACEGKVRKLFSSVGIVFRGPGFYRTDSRAIAGDEAKEKSSKNGEKAAKNGEKSSNKGGEKSDSKSGGDKSSSGSGSSGSGSASGSEGSKSTGNAPAAAS